MIQFKDFAPQQTQSGWFTNSYESMQETLEKANAWIQNNDIDFVNIETVVLPEMWGEEGTEDPELSTSAEFINKWYQFVRVWYRE